MRRKIVIAIFLVFLCGGCAPIRTAPPMTVSTEERRIVLATLSMRIDRFAVDSDTVMESLESLCQEVETLVIMGYLPYDRKRRPTGDMRNVTVSDVLTQVTTSIGCTWEALADKNGLVVFVLFEPGKGQGSGGRPIRCYGARWRTLSPAQKVRVLSDLLAADVSTDMREDIVGELLGVPDVAEERLVPILIEALRKDCLLGNAAHKLGEIGDKAAVPVLIRAAFCEGEDEEGHYRRINLIAAEALGKIGEKSAIPTFRRLLQLNGWEAERTECVAAKALANLGDRSGIPVLIQGLKSNIEDISEMYGQEVEDVKSEPRYRSMYEDVSWDYLESLKEITGRDFGCDYDKWSHWWQENKENLGNGR